MSLNNEQMLPARVRKMRQMEDLLNAEDIILAEIERIIEAMYQEAAMLHEELVNEEWLEKKLLELTGSQTKVTGDAWKLLVDILMDVSEMGDPDLQEVRRFLNKWLPAHLQYKLRYLLKYVNIHTELLFLYEIAIQLDIAFWKARTLDGSWLLDGTYCLDAVRKSDNCGIGYEIGESGHQEKMRLEAFYLLDFWLRERCSDVRIAVKMHCQGVTPNTKLGCLKIGTGTTPLTERYETGVRIRKDYWVLDGVHVLNGTKELKALQIEEDL